MLILYSILVLEKQAKENNFNKDIFVATSLTRYFNNELALQQLEYFEIYSQKSEVGI